jgi:hypothetical protein
MVDTLAVRKVSYSRLVLEDGNGTVVTIQPATYGGGRAFTK